MQSSYWPSKEVVKFCMRKEAEELPDEMLLAVHHPVSLEKKNLEGEQVGGNLSEFDLLEAVIKIDRPIPIIGRAGSGKSHLIRWLDAHLRTKKETKHWHVVRIPKNSSLRSSLELLLEGLTGEHFDTLRSRIKTVGEKLEVQEVANHLVVFVASVMEGKHRVARKSHKDIQEGNVKPREGDKERLQMLNKHAGPEGLPALIKDQNFNGALVGENCCFYNIAKHLTEGSTDDEIEESDFAVREEDIKFKELGNLGKHAQDYVRNKLIHTSQEARLEVVGLLNECIAEAQQRAFQQFFKFSAGDFGDLFQEIRRAFKSEKKVLCVLVEDLRQISAIEDVLMDALSQESVYAGKEQLCPLHSAIAVTEGHRGYVSRRDSVVDRAEGEWVVSQLPGDDDSLHDSIQNFCGRYLNAARQGLEGLTTDGASKDNAESWPPIWQSDDDNERSIAAAFGESPLGFPLFPFNKHALRALVEKECRSATGLAFNPRILCQHVLVDSLNQRESYESGQFPPASFGDIGCGVELQGELHRALKIDVDRSASFAAVWGGKSKSVANLAANVTPEMAEEFGLDDLFKLLKKTEPSKLETPSPTKVPVKLPTAPSSEPIAETPVLNRMELIPGVVDEYFKSKQIPQEPANLIRQALIQRIEQSTHLAQWTGLTKWPPLKMRSQPFVKVHYNSNNPNFFHFEFGSEKEFGNQSNSLPYREFMIALLRHHESGGNWTYADGCSDCINYHNFLDKWMEDSRAVHVLTKTREDKIREQLEEALTIAPVFTPSIANSSSIEKIDGLVEEIKVIRERIPKTGTTEWDEEFGKLLGEWQEIQSQWLGNFSIKRYGIEGDLLKKHLHGVSGKDLPSPVSRVIRRTRELILNQLPGLELLKGCNNREEFQNWFESLADVIKKVISDAQWKNMAGGQTAQKTLNKIKKVQEDSEMWSSVKPILSILGEFEVTQVLRAFQQLDRGRASIVNECLEIWKLYYDGNLTRLENENQGFGAKERLRVEKQADQFIGAISELLRSIQEGEVDVVAN